MIEEKVFFSEKKAFADNEVLKMNGFEYEGNAALGMEKDGFYMLIKAEKDWFKKKEVVEALKDTKEVTGKEKAKVLKKFAELTENAGAGIALFD